MDPLAQRRAALHRTISQAQLQLDALELVPIEDIYPNGTIIRAEILNPGKRDPLTYVFLKVIGPEYVRCPEYVRWYHTGLIHLSTKSGNRSYFEGWVELQRWLTEPGRVVETWEGLIRNPTPTGRIGDDVKGLPHD